MRRTLVFLTVRERLTYFSLITLRAVVSILDIIGIALIGIIGGLAVSGAEANGQLSFLGFELPDLGEQGLVVLTVIVLIVFILKAIFAVILSKVMTLFVAKIEVSHVKEIGHFLFVGKLGRLESYSRAEMQWAVTESATNAFNLLLNSFATIVNEAVLLVLICGTFLLVDAPATLAVIIFFGILAFLIQFAIGRGLTYSGIEATEGTMETSAAVQDLTSAFREIVVVNKQSYFLDKLTHSRQRLSEGMGLLWFLGGMPRYVVETGLMIGVVAFVGWQFLSGQLAEGVVTVGVFLTGGVRIMASLLPLQGAYVQMQNQQEKAALAQEILGLARIEAAESDQDQKLPSVSKQEEPISFGALELFLEGASFAYEGSTSPAIENVSLNVEAGQHVAIIGPSGAGKTTLVDLILGLIHPTQGSVSIGGVSPEHLRLLRPDVVAYVPQSPGLVAGTLAQNIALGISDEDIDFDRIHQVIDEANLREFVLELPDGLNTDVGKQGTSFSGGQIQRLGLARALYRKPKLLVLDEATSALDARSEAVISQTLSGLGKEVTVITIAHRLSTVQHSDVVFVMEGGKLTASGTFSQLRKTVPMVANYVELMSFDELE